MKVIVPDNIAYQVNTRRMSWTALLMMCATTAATIYDPTRMNEASGVLQVQYLALSGLVGAYFALSSKMLGSKSE